jgi:uncharacterized membrane protein YdbT with pleckstrin-like domain
VGFPDGVLTADEEIVLHLRPHVKVVLRPILVSVAAVVAVAVALVMLPDDPGGRIGMLVVGVGGLMLALARGVWPLCVWRCTHYVFTSERILLQDGVLARARRDLPLNRVNDHATSQGVLDRILGCGTLTVDALGERGPAVLVAVPGVQKVQTTLYELIENDRDRHDGEDDAPVRQVLPTQSDRAASRRQAQP